MNKKELGLILARRMNITQVEAKRLTNALFDILMEEISSGVSVKISGFGSFYLRPKLRGSFRRRIVFRPGKTLKAMWRKRMGSGRTLDHQRRYDVGRDRSNAKVR